MNDLRKLQAECKKRLVSTLAWTSKPWVQIPGLVPGSFRWTLLSKGRTFIKARDGEPIEKAKALSRLHGKGPLRIAKAARVAQRIEDFAREAIRRGNVTACLFSDYRRQRDRLLNIWRKAA